MSAPDLTKSDRTTVRRRAERARYDWPTVSALLDEALLCHVGFAVDGRTSVVPTTFVRVERALYLHGATGNHALRTLTAGGVDACVTVTALDGLVLAKSAFHHSMNYRSVMLFGTVDAVTDAAEKRSVLDAMVDRMAPERSRGCRPPTESELRATLVGRLAIDEGSAKVRTGAPVDDDEDLALPYWSGVIPLTVTKGDPIEATLP